jgi:hypothetical protein
MQPGRVQAAHQSLHHFVAKADWSHGAVLAAVLARVLPVIERRGRIRAQIIDDTGMPKKGKHSVGVARQYCGQLGKQDSCQVVVSLPVANDHASLPIAYGLYLLHEWADDPNRRAGRRASCRRVTVLSFGWHNAANQWAGYPDRTAAIADGRSTAVASGIDIEFTAQRMCPRIYLHERYKGCRDPDETTTNGYGTPFGRAGFNRGEELAGLAIDLIDGAVPRVENPD